MTTVVYKDENNKDLVKITQYIFTCIHGDHPHTVYLIHKLVG